MIVTEARAGSQHAARSSSRRALALRRARAVLLTFASGILTKTKRLAHRAGGSAMRARARAENDLRTGDPEFVAIVHEIERKVISYLRGSTSVDLFQEHLRGTLAWVGQARHLVDKTISQGDFDQCSLERRRKCLQDLETMVHGKLDWLERHANRGAVREALGTSGSITHFLIAGSKGPDAWLVLMNWVRRDGMIQGFSPRQGGIVTLRRQDIVDWHAG